MQPDTAGDLLLHRTWPHCAPLWEPHVSGVGSIEPLGFCPEAGPLRLSEAWVCPRVTPGEGVAGNKGPIQFWVGGGWGGAGPGGRAWWGGVLGD